MLDDCQVLFVDEETAATIRDYLFTLTEQQHRVQLLFALTGRETQPPATHLRPFTALQTYLLKPLDHSATCQLVQEPVPYKVFRDTTDYIDTITAGNPQAIQAVCHALYERWRDRELAQVTLRDRKSTRLNSSHSSVSRMPSSA